MLWRVQNILNYQKIKNVLNIQKIQKIQNCQTIQKIKKIANFAIILNIHYILIMGGDIIKVT